MLEWKNVLLIVSTKNIFFLSFRKSVWNILWNNDHNKTFILCMDHQNLTMHIKRWQQISQRFLIDRSIQTNNNFLSLLIWWILMYTIFNCWNMPKVTQCQGYMLEKIPRHSNKWWISNFYVTLMFNITEYRMNIYRMKGYVNHDKLYHT